MSDPLDISKPTPCSTTFNLGGSLGQKQKNEVFGEKNAMPHKNEEKKMDKDTEKEIKLQVSTEINGFLRTFALSAVGSVLAILFGVFAIVNIIASAKSEASNERISGLEKNMNIRFEAAEKNVNAKFDTVNARFDAADKRAEAQMQVLQDIQRWLPK